MYAVSHLCSLSICYLYSWCLDCLTSLQCIIEPHICYLYSASTGVSVLVRSICTDQLECMYMSTGVSVGVNGEAHQASQFCMCQHTYSCLLTKAAHTYSHILTPTHTYTPNLHTYSLHLPTPRFQPYLPPTKSPHNPKHLAWLQIYMFHETSHQPGFKSICSMKHPASLASNLYVPWNISPAWLRKWMFHGTSCSRPASN